MGIRIHAVASAAVLLLAAPALAEVLKVPSEAYPTIQSAVDAAGDGDVILLAKAPTAYNENLVIEGKSNLTIRGAGRSTGISGAIISEDSTIRISGGTNITLRGFDLSTGISGTSATCQASGVAGLRIVDVEFRGSGDTGLSTAGCTGVLVSRCGFYSYFGDVILDDGSSGFVVERCFFLYPYGLAVNLSPGAAPGEGTSGAVVRKNVVRGPGVAADDAGGIRVTGDGAVIDRNDLGVSGDVGIAVTGTGTVVSRNRVHGNGTAISVSGAEATVTENRIRRMSGVGILVLSSGVTVSKNRATDSNVLDLADTQAEGVNTYEKNRFGTTQFSFVP